MHENIGIEIARYFSRVHSRGRSLELELQKVSSLKPCARHSFSRKYSTSFCSWFYRYSRKGTCIILHPVLLKVQNVAQNALPSAVFSACSAPLRTRMTTSPQIIAENRLDFIFHHFCIHIPLDPLFSLRLRSDLQLTCRIFLKVSSTWHLNHSNPSIHPKRKALKFPFRTSSCPNSPRRPKGSWP